MQDIIYNEHMEKYQVSVIIPTHNNELYIEKAIKSVINQTFKGPIEILVLNDNCTDNTDAIVEKLVKDNSNIHYLHVNNRCEGRTRMDGIKNAKGEYIMWLDGDDYYHPEMVEKMYNAITKNDADLANCSLYTINKSGIHRDLFRKNKIYYGNKALKAFFNDIYIRGFFHTKIYKASLLKEIKLNLPYRNFIYVDSLYNFFYFIKCNKVVTIKDSLLYYNKLNASSITAKGNARIQDNVNVRAFIRYKIDQENDLEILRIFKKQYQRVKQLLLVDSIMSSFKNKDEKKKTIKLAKKELKEIYKCQHLNIENHSYTEFIKNTDQEAK